MGDLPGAPDGHSPAADGGRLRGRADNLAGDFVGQYSDDQLGQQPGPRQRGVHRRQPVQARQRLEPLEAKLDLPAVAIHPDDALRRLGLADSEVARIR